MTDSKRAQIWVVLALVGLVILSITITSLVMHNTGKGSADAGYRHVTMTDAYMKCAKQLKKEFGSRLGGYGEDQLSSRFNQAKGRYQIYIDAQIKNADTGIQEAAYISCQVNERGKVKSFGTSIAGEDGSDPEPVDGGNPFGYDV